MPTLSKLNVSYPKVWVVIGVGLAGALILAEVHRRRIKAQSNINEDFGAFVERFELLPFPQPPPPAARLPLSGLTFAVSDKYVLTFSLFCFLLNFIFLILKWVQLISDVFG